ncbi:MAG: hypothetical protein E7513_04525 [Ruminococcaceae bacterium]|nr:hypothetical protein [Oscillospiraceae bacterium]
MPFIDARFTTPVNATQEENIKTKLGEAITLIGKSEAYLMVQIEDNCRMYFKGNKDDESAYFEVKLLGKSTKANYEKLTKALCDIASEELSIPTNRVYVKFEEVEYWGYDSIIF